MILYIYSKQINKKLDKRYQVGEYRKIIGDFEALRHKRRKNLRLSYIGH